MSLIKKINDPNGKKYDDFSIGSLVLDTEPIPGSFNPVTSDGVKNAIDDSVDAAKAEMQEKIDEVTLDPSAVALGNVHLLDEVTEFPADGCILVDSETNGARKMSKDTLLELTAQNALAGNVAPAFDPTKPNDEGGYSYYAGTSVTHEGKNYVFIVNHLSGVWNPDEVEQKPLSESINMEGVGEAVATWLDEHPEATTTVEDGSLYESKFSDTLKLKTIKDYVTPEMFGAKGDDTHDDSTAIQAAIATSKPVLLLGKTYRIETSLDVLSGTTIEGCGFSSVIHAVGCDAIVSSSNRTGVHILNLRLLGDLDEDNPTTKSGIKFIPAMPKCVLNNLHISRFGDYGIYLDNSWDYEITDVNLSQNKNGLYANKFNSSSLHKVVAWQNEQLGVVLEESAQARISGTVQENGKTGLLLKGCFGCDVSVYGEQNGFNGTSNEERSQIVLTSGGLYNDYTLNCRILFYLIGGVGSDMESAYGLYINWASWNNIEGWSKHHVVQDYYETSNSSSNLVLNINRNGNIHTAVSNVDLMEELPKKCEIAVHNASTICNYCMAGEDTSGTINFGVTFDSVPKILLTPLNTSEKLNFYVASRTKLGFTFKCFETDGTERTDIYFSWLAIGNKT